METTEPVEKKGISRRAVIVNGAVGAAAFWSVPVIDSITQRAAAASGCQPAAPLAISGAAVVFTIGSSPTVYWAAFGAGGTTCLATPTVPSDSDFASPVAACGGYVQVLNGSVLWGTTALNVSEPTPTPSTVPSIPCYFSATANGVAVTAAGIAAGVNVLVYVFHNGTFPGACTTYGSKGHWALACGSTNPNCGQSGNCI